MLIDLTGRTALITGSSSGLGLAIGRRMAASGANVILVARSEDRLRAAETELRETSKGKVASFVCDVTDPDARTDMMATALTKFGVIDILVNNAGSSQRGPVEDQTREDMTADLDLKVMSPIALIQACLPGMKAQAWGRIINVSAIVGKHPDAGSLPTSISRAAGITMTKTLSKELAPHNILVNALCVGKIKSGQWERRHAAKGGPQSYEDFLKPTADTVPLNRMGKAIEFAQVACFLASDMASYVTGTAINVDGGLSAVT